MTGWNLPPGCTGNEKEIAGLSKKEEEICNACKFFIDDGCDPPIGECPLDKEGGE